MVVKQSVINVILIAQIIVTSVFAISLIWLGKHVALSALLGGLICVIPNMYLARKLSVRPKAIDGELKDNLYAAVFGKLILTMAAFASVFATLEWIQPVILMIGFGLAQLTHWLAPIVVPIFNKNRDK